MVLLGGLGCACTRPSVAVGEPEAAAPMLWVEARPTLEPEHQIDESAWSGEWAEYFPGRLMCQDRFTLRAEGATIKVGSIDCSTDLPYEITDIRWDGQTLSFVAEVSDGGLELHYSVALDAPGQISGTANDTEITWSRTD